MCSCKVRPIGRRVTDTIVAMRPSIGVLFALLAVVDCAIPTSPSPRATKRDPAADAAPPVCCRTDPDAGPEGCLCEPAATDIIMVSDTTCSASTTVNGQAVDFTGIVVSTCP